MLVVASEAAVPEAAEAEAVVDAAAARAAVVVGPAAAHAVRVGAGVAVRHGRAEDGPPAADCRGRHRRVDYL